MLPAILVACMSDEDPMASVQHELAADAPMCSPTPLPPGRRTSCCMLARHQLWPFSDVLAPTRSNFRHVYGTGARCPPMRSG
jgi:hypothetical protein